MTRNGHSFSDDLDQATPMPLTSPPMIGMNLEDFRRLGVRPYECRLTVIRRAAARSSKALAEKQLSAPSEQVGLQLSRVATSTYRLLDPRQRPDPTQRAFVGRILPNTLSWAGQTSFYNDSDSGSPETEVNRGSVSDAELIEMLDLDDSPRLPESECWAVSLNDDDLLEQGPRARQAARLRKHWWHPWIPLSMAGLLVGALLGFATLKTSQETTVGQVIPADWEMEHQTDAGSSVVDQTPTPMSTQSHQREQDVAQEATPSIAQVPKTDADVSERRSLPESNLPDSNSDESETHLVMPETTRPKANAVAEAKPAVNEPHGETNKPIGAPAERDDQDDVVANVDNAGASEPVAGATSLEMPTPVESSKPSEIARSTKPKSVSSTEGLGRGGLSDEPTTGLMASDSAPEPRLEEADIGLEPMSVEASGTDAPTAPDSSPDPASSPAAPAVVVDKFLPDPFTGSRPDAPPPSSEIATRDAVSPPMIESPPMVAKNDLAVTSNDTSVEPDLTRHPVPDAESLRVSREQLTAQVPELLRTLGVKEVAPTIAKIEALEKEFEIGTADHWVSQLAVAELSWQVDDFPVVLRRLKPLQDNYDTPDMEPLVSSFLAACQSASFPETHQRILDSGLRLGNLLLTRELLDECKQLIEAASPSADAIGDKESEQHLAQLTESMNKIDRLKASTRRMIDAGKVESDQGDLGILGRYYCLMLRQWEVGLPWLTEVSDSRIASVARRESELGTSAPAEEWIALAQRWFTAASRSSGRAADSMRLHGIEILRRVADETSGLNKLEIERQIDEANDLLPSFLREPSPRMTGLQSMSSSQTGSASASAVDGMLGGRIRMDGRDLGVQLDYELGVAFNQTLLENVADRLSTSLSQVSIEFLGEFRLEKSADLAFTMAMSKDDVRQNLLIDGQPLDVDRGIGTAEASLEAGKHTVAWSIDASEIPRSFLRISSTGPESRIRVETPSDPPSDGAATVLTVAMVRNSP